MRIEEQVLAPLDRCYAASRLFFNNEYCPVFASEGEGPCYLFSGKHYEVKNTIWEKPGGTMSLIEIPWRKGEFLAVQNFKRNFEAQDACVVHGRPSAAGGWEVTPLLQLPYLHRFDLLERNGQYYFLGATLCSSKKEREDWSDPGKIYVGALSPDLDRPVALAVLKDGLTKNHGYAHVVWHGQQTGLVAAHEGIFAVSPPSAHGLDWNIEQLTDTPTSDVAAIDLDGDGELELVTISPFHGSDFRVLKQIYHRWECVYTYPVQNDFYHVVKSCILAGRPMVLGGCRRGQKQLFAIAYNRDTQQYESILIDEEVGPSNVDVIPGSSCDIIVSANREIGVCTLYYVYAD